MPGPIRKLGTARPAIQLLTAERTTDGMPISGGDFVVLLELHPAADVAQQQLEKSFEVQEVTGERWKWSPEEDKRRGPGDNGKLPE